MLRMRRALIAIAATWIFFLFIARVFGQDATPTPAPKLSPEQARLQAMTEQLEREKRIAELERDIASAEKGTRDAAPVSVKPNTGGLTLSEDDVARDIIVYRALGQVDVRVAGKLRSAVPRGSTIVIFDAAAFADWTFYRRSLPLFKIVIGDLAADYCQVARGASGEEKSFQMDSVGAASAIASATNVVGQIADLLSYFRTETTMTGKAVSVTEDAVVADLFSQLRDTSPDLKLLYPKTFALDLPVMSGETTVRRACCTAEKGEACNETRAVYSSEIANALDDLYRARRAAYTAKKESVELKRLDKYFDDFMQMFTAPASGGSDTALRKYINAEQYANLNKRDDLYYLEIKSVKAVGTTRVRKNLFFLADKLDYSGGIVLEWTLFEKSGEVRASGIETSFDGFIPPKQIRKP